VVCRQQDLERCAKSSRPAPPCRCSAKTYIDSVALTAKLFEADFPMLHIFAGANIASPARPLMSLAAFSSAAASQDKPLYKVVLRHYIGYLMEKRFR
jgi:glycerol-3-phosphate O-acyltransferase